MDTPIGTTLWVNRKPPSGCAARWPSGIGAGLNSTTAAPAGGLIDQLLADRIAAATWSATFTGAGSGGGAAEPICRSNETVTEAINSDTDAVPQACQGCGPVRCTTTSTAAICLLPKRSATEPRMTTAKLSG